MKYTITFNTFNNPSVSFFSDEIKDGNYDLLENEYDFSDFDAEVELEQYQDFMKQLNATSDLTVRVINQFFGLTNSTFQFTTTDSVNVDDEILIDDEIVKVTSIATTGGISTVTALRGLYGTRKTGHNTFLDTTITATINGRWSPVGIEGLLTDEDGKDLQYVYIDDISSNGSSVILFMRGILNKFDKEFNISGANTITGTSPKYSINGAIKNIFGGLLLSDGVFDKLVNEIYLKDGEEIEGNWGNVYKINPLEALLELLKLTGSFLMFNQSSLQYEIRSILGLSVFDNISSDTNLFDSILLNGGGYKSTVKNLASNLEVKFSLNKGYQDDAFVFEDKTYTVQASTSGASMQIVSETKEVDLSAFEIRDIEILKKISRKYMYIYGLILGHIELTSIKGNIFEVGKYYNSEGLKDNREIVTFINDSIDRKLYCYARNDETVRFLIVNVQEYQPISPALVMKVNSDTEVELTLDIQDFLYTNDNEINGATHLQYDYFFFDKGYDIQFRNMDNYELIGTANIINIAGNVVTLTSAVYGLTLYTSVVMTYDVKTVASSIINKHLFVDEGVL